MASGLAPIVVCIGDEAWLWNETLTRLTAQCIQPGSEALDRVVLHAESVPREVVSALQTPPMNSPKRLVILEDFLETQGEALEWLMRYAAHPNRSSCLVVRLEEPLPAAAGPALRKVMQEISCRPLKDAALENWLKKRLGQRGKTIEPEALRVLMERTGTSMALLSQRLEQIALYARGRQVTRDDVVALVGWSVEERAFGLVDVILSRNRPAAMRMLRHLLLEDGVAPEEILGALGWHFRRLGKAVYRAGRGESAQSVVQSLGIPWRVQGTYLTAVRSMRWADAVRTLQELAAIDEQLKTGRVAALALLEPFVWRLSAARRVEAAPQPSG
ncbi:MAG: DNA polymerase III subunit delta [Candidatus Omnitrophica bacterium]|nr:DNA polymerase III subunit delta [Candidatus Omnitrophota bacterium]